MNVDKEYSAEIALENDAKTISQILIANYDYVEVLENLKKYASLEPHRRVQKVLQDYFNRAAKNVSYETLYQKGLFIQKIFPTVSINEILGMLRDVAYEENSTRFVIRKLLLTTKNHSKRTHSSNFNVDKVNKRLKVSTNPNHPSTSKNHTDTSLIPNGDLHTEEDIVEENETHLPSYLLKTPNPQEILIKPEPNDCNDTSAYNYLLDDEEIPYNTDNTAVTSSGEFQQQLPEPDSQTTIIMSPDVLDNYNLISDLGGVKIKTENVAEAAPSDIADPICTVNDQQVKLVPFNHPIEPSTSKACENPAKYNFNLHKHLEEMFSNASKLRIKKVFSKYSVDEYTKPTEAVFDAIVSELLQREPDDDSVDSVFDQGKNNDESKSGADVKTIIEVVHYDRPKNDAKDKITEYYETDDDDEDDDDLENDDYGENEFDDDDGEDDDEPIDTDLYLRKVMRYNAQRYNLNVPTTSCMITNNFPSPSTSRTSRNPAADRVARCLETDDSLIKPCNKCVECVKEVIVGVPETDENEDDNKTPVENDDPKVYQALIGPLMEMFPEACPQHIRTICREKENNPAALDELISQMLVGDYPKRKVVVTPEQTLSFDEQLETMKQILPEADPNYLKFHCELFFSRPDALKAFIATSLETRDYPTMKEYLRKQQLSSQQKQYTTEFSVQKFLDVIPDPVAYFNDKNRKAPTVNPEGFNYAVCFLRNHYPRIQIQKIRETFKSKRLNFLETCKVLDKMNKALHMKSKRHLCRMPEIIQNIPLLQEIAYFEHKDEILKYIEEQKLNDKMERDNARIIGLFQTCECCYDDEVMPKHIYSCDNGCRFCKDCVKKGAEVAFGDGKLDFLCLSNCSSHFSLQTLQAVLNPKMFSVIALKKQLEEVKAAGIEDLEVCPFCDFATIPVREDKLFRCLNPECMKESCRLCKEPSHVPLRCDEVEKEHDVRNRVYIENKMTEALIRKCYKCGLKFIKADGCNKMTCSCGAMMCYVCGKPVRDYKHFNGNGGNQYQLCPLYSDTNKLHEEAVLEGATKAKQEIGVDNDPAKLKNDPTIDVRQHYAEQAHRKPRPAIHLQNLGAIDRYGLLYANQQLRHRRGLPAIIFAANDPGQMQFELNERRGFHQLRRQNNFPVLNIENNFF